MGVVAMEENDGDEREIKANGDREIKRRRSFLSGIVVVLLVFLKDLNVEGEEEKNRIKQNRKNIEKGLQSLPLLVTATHMQNNRHPCSLNDITHICATLLLLIIIAIIIVGFVVITVIAVVAVTVSPCEWSLDSDVFVDKSHSGTGN